MMKIALESIRIHGYHGVYEVEKDQGNEFEVDVWLFLNMNEAVASDEIIHTINYQRIYDIVLEVFDTRVNLLEHLCYKTGNKLLDEYDSLEKVWVRVSKIEPLYMEKCKKATVELTMYNKKVGEVEY